MSKWIYKNLKNPEFQTLAEQFNVHPAIIKILADRGIQGEEAVREYLKADISRVSDGSELTDMQRGVDIVYDAVQAGKYIRIMGDYDVDGVSSTYILYKGLTGLGAKCDKFIPHRITDGYGLHEPAIRDAYEAGVQVILTCDNGIAASIASHSGCGYEFFLWEMFQNSIDQHCFGFRTIKSFADNCGICK